MSAQEDSSVFDAPQGDATPKATPVQPAELITKDLPPSHPEPPLSPSPTPSRSSSGSSNSESKSERRKKATVSGVGQGNYSTLGGSPRISRPTPPRKGQGRAVSTGSPLPKLQGSGIGNMSSPLTIRRGESTSDENGDNSYDTSGSSYYLSKNGEPFTPYEDMGETYFNKHWSTYDPNGLGKIVVKDTFKFFGDLQKQTPGLVDDCLFSSMQRNIIFNWASKNKTKTLSKDEFKEMYAQATGSDLFEQIYRISSKAAQGVDAKAENANDQLSVEDYKRRQERFVSFMNGEERPVTPEMPSTFPELQGTPHFGDRPPVRNLLSDFEDEPFKSPTRLDLQNPFPFFSPQVQSTALFSPEAGESERERIAELKEENARLIVENERIHNRMEADQRDIETERELRARDQQSDGMKMEQLQNELAESSKQNEALTKDVRTLRKERDLHLQQLENAEADRAAAIAERDSTQRSLEREVSELRRARDQENSRRNQVNAQADSLKRAAESLKAQVKHFRDLYETAKENELQHEIKVKELTSERAVALETIKNQDLHIKNQDDFADSLVNRWQEWSRQGKMQSPRNATILLGQEIKDAEPDDSQYSFWDREIEWIQTESEKRRRARQSFVTPPRNEKKPADFVGDVEYIQRHTTMNYVGEGIQTNLTIEPFYKDSDPGIHDFVQDPIMASFRTLRNSGSPPADMTPLIENTSEAAIQTSAPNSPLRPEVTRQFKTPLSVTNDTYTETVSTTQSLYSRLISFVSTSKPLSQEDINTINTFIKAQPTNTLIYTVFQLPPLIESSQRRDKAPKPIQSTPDRSNPSTSPGIASPSILYLPFAILQNWLSASDPASYTQRSMDTPAIPIPTPPSTPGARHRKSNIRWKNSSDANSSSSPSSGPHRMFRNLFFDPGVGGMPTGLWTYMSSLLLAAIAVLMGYNALLYYSLKSDESRWLQANGDVWGQNVAGCYRVCPGDGNGWRWKAMVWEAVEEYFLGS